MRSTSLLLVLGSLLSVAALTVAGCGSTVQNGGDADGADDGSDDDSDDGSDDDGTDDGSDDDSTDGGDPTCPLSEPTPGGACEGLDLTCVYPDDMPCGDMAGERRFTCEDGAWSQPVTERCSPPEPICPELEPWGESCPPEAEGLSCDYEVEVDCGDGTDTVTFVCEDGSWESGGGVDRCALPPPCWEYLDATSCGDAFDCQWLEPGCGEDALTVAGCYQAGDCLDFGCMQPEEQCVVLNTGACGDDCSCASDRNVCVPVTGEE